MSIIPPFTTATDRGYKFLRVFDQYYGSRGNAIGLYVEGGVSPYDWVVTGTDFTLNEAQTIAQFNYVTVDAAAVLDNTETVTVTDAEGSTVTITVCTCNPISCADDPNYAFDGTYTLDKLVADMLPEKCSKIHIGVGCPPYSWVSNNDNFYFLRDNTNVPENVICANKDAVATMSLTITEVVGVCGYVTAMTLDAGSTSDTIAPGGNASVFVLNGKSPYTWSVVGTGYSITPEGESDLLTATVSCVAGTCGVNFAAYATVTIVDDCGTSVSTIIRNTAGSWTNLYRYSNSGGSCVGTPVPYPCADSGTTRYIDWEIDGANKWVTDANIPQDGNWCTASGAWNQSACYIPPCYGESPTCGTPIGCGGGHGGICYNYSVSAPCANSNCKVTAEYAYRQRWSC